jgi:hypothetical protein
MHTDTAPTRSSSGLFPNTIRLVALPQNLNESFLKRRLTLISLFIFTFKFDNRCSDY